MQDPNEDTEWNDILRSRGILPPLQEIHEESDLCEDESLDNLNSDELSEMDDDDNFFRQYKLKRLNELKLSCSKKKYGEVIEIRKPDFIKEVTEASKNVSVICLLYNSHETSKLMLQHFNQLAIQFSEIKFVRIVATNCIENYPEKNLPAVFVYRNSELISQLIGPSVWGGMGTTCEEVESILRKTGVIQSDLIERPKTLIQKETIN